jgi:pimeloyl-ACP methyl ester carboxylesterase
MDASTQPVARYTTLSDIKFHYTDWGGAGNPILLLHGLGSTVHIWDLVAPQLSQWGRTVAMDLRGHGLSNQPDEGYDFATIAQDVVDFIQFIAGGERVLLVGHSWGAYVALYVAANFPDSVRNIALIDGGIMDLKSQWRSWEIAEHHMTPPDMSNKTADELRMLIQNEWLKEAWSQEIEELALHSFSVDENNLVQPRLARSNHMQIAKAIWEFMPAHHHMQIGCPALLVVPSPPGMSEQLDDWQTDKQRQVEAAERQMQNGRVVWLDETIHDIPWHRPHDLVELLTDFWKTSGE